MTFSVNSPEYKARKEYLNSDQYRIDQKEKMDYWSHNNVNERAEKRRETLNKFSPIEEQDDFVELSGKYIMDILWNNVVYLSSLSGPAATTTSASELFTSDTREADTSAGKFLTSKRNSRFRARFYFNDAASALDATVYIGSIGTSTEALSASVTSINGTYMEYLALKIVNGDLYIVSKNEHGTTTQEVVQTIVDSTTNVLEINYSAQERADFYLNSIYIGSISDNLPVLKDTEVFFPLMVSITRSAGTNRTVTVESWEFIQERN